MFIVMLLPPSKSAPKVLKSFFDHIDENRHPGWVHENTLDNREVIFHNPYQFYKEKSVIFLPYIKDNSIVFESSHWSTTPSPGVEQVKNHIIRLCAFLLKEYFEEGVSIQIM